MKPGDVVVQRGAVHAWVNHGPAPCVFAFILIVITEPAQHFRSPAWSGNAEKSLIRAE